MVRKVVCNLLGKQGMACIHPQLKVRSLCSKHQHWGIIWRREKRVGCSDALSLRVRRRGWGSGGSEKSR